MECDLLTWAMLLLPLVCSSAMNTAEPDKVLVDGTNYTEALPSPPSKAALLGGRSDVTSATELIFSETPKDLSSKHDATYKPVNIVASRGPFTDEPSTTIQTSLAATASQTADEDPLKKSQATPAFVLALTTASTVSSTLPSAIPPQAAPSNVPSTSHDADSTAIDHNITAQRETTSDYRSTVASKMIEETTTVKDNTNNQKKKNQKPLFVLIVVIIVIIILLSLTMIILLIRKKRRSGSQSFHTKSRKSDRKDVWAGQVPELEDGKAVHNELRMENGKSGNQQEAGHEMTTFVSGEKKADSVVERDVLLPGGATEGNGTDNLVKEDSSEEKRPLLEGNSEGAQETEAAAMDDQFSVIPMEQELL